MQITPYLRVKDNMKHHTQNYAPTSADERKHITLKTGNETCERSRRWRSVNSTASFARWHRTTTRTFTQH